MSQLNLKSQNYEIQRHIPNTVSDNCDNFQILTSIILLSKTMYQMPSLYSLIKTLLFDLHYLLKGFIKHSMSRTKSS